MAEEICFVMMPSGLHDEYEYGSEEADYVYEEVIVPAVEDVLGSNVEIKREIDNRQPGAITAAIIGNIAKADLAIVDITGQNPNVFLELGVRYSLRRNATILLRQESTPVPFDIGHLRCITYRSIFSGAKKAREDIVHALKKIRAAESKTSDSIVFDALPQLEVKIPNVHAPDFDHEMPWSTFWDRFTIIVERIRDLHKDGRYVPTAVVGITNGGAMFADLLCRELFTGVPMLSLWADRYKQKSQRGRFFDNQVNDKIVSALKGTAPEGANPTLLLVDDIVASGTTHSQAINYLQEKLPDAELHFLPLFSRNEKYFELIVEHVLWKHDAFDMSDDEIRDLHSINWIHLPYKKDIRSA